MMQGTVCKGPPTEEILLGNYVIKYSELIYYAHKSGSKHKLVNILQAKIGRIDSLFYKRLH